MSRSTTKGKGGTASSLKTRSSQQDVPPLFCSEPEKNFSLWVQNCFPDTVVTREDAIRQWLTSPLETRVQNRRKNSSDNVKSNGEPTPASASQLARSRPSSSEASAPILTIGNGWNFKPVTAVHKDERIGRFASTGRNLSRWLLRLARFAVMALLIVIILRASPMGKGTSQANDSTKANETNNAGVPQVSNPPAADADKAIDPVSDLPSVLLSIENLSVGCDDTQPCVQIRTRGKASLPTLNTLSEPDRVIMDFPNAVLSPNIKGILGHGAVKDIRVAQHTDEPSYTRLVIDLTEKCNYELRTETNGFVLKISPEAIPHQAGSRGY